MSTSGVTPERTPDWLRRGSRLSVLALSSGLLHAVCTLFLVINAIAVWLGLGGITAATLAHLVHADLPRRILLAVALSLASVTLYVLRGAWRLRMDPAAAWRRQPLTSREKWRFGVSLGFAVLALCLVLSEIVAHLYLYRTI
jgi:hypothetical protein